MVQVIDFYVSILVLFESIPDTVLIKKKPVWGQIFLMKILLLQNLFKHIDLILFF